MRDSSNTISPAEKKRRAKLMAEIGYLAYVVNAETDYCVFFEYSGHVDLIRLEICRSKDRYTETVASSEHYSSDDGKEAWIKSKIRHLKHILETGGVDYSRMKRAVYEVASYEF